MPDLPGNFARRRRAPSVLGCPQARVPPGLRAAICPVQQRRVTPRCAREWAMWRVHPRWSEVSPKMFTCLPLLTCGYVASIEVKTNDFLGVELNFGEATLNLVDSLQLKEHSAWVPCCTRAVNQQPLTNYPSLSSIQVYFYLLTNQQPFIKHYCQWLSKFLKAGRKNTHCQQRNLSNNMMFDFVQRLFVTQNLVVWSHKRAYGSRIMHVKGDKGLQWSWKCHILGSQLPF